MRNKKFVIYIGKHAVQCNSVDETVQSLKDAIICGDEIIDIRPNDKDGGKVVSAIDVFDLLKKAKIRLSVDDGSN